MSTVSGFDPLFAEVAKRNDIHSKCIFIAEPRGSYASLTLVNRLWRKVRNAGRSSSTPVKVASSPWVRPQHEAVATDIVKLATKIPNARVVLSAGENQFGIRLRDAVGLRHSVVFCAHQPPSWYRLFWRDFSDLDDMGSIVCLCPEQASFFQSVCNSKTVVIKHGVNLEFFHPSIANVSMTKRLMFVGQWLRDFETLEKSMRLVWEQHPEATLECVVPFSARQHTSLLRLATDDRVTWYAGISAGCLRNLYQQASLLFLPLIDGTANNAVVEALACGLPVISTNVGGIANYIPPSAGELCKAGDEQSHAEAVCRWLSNRDLREAGTSAARRFAEEQLGWQKIATDLIQALA